VSTEALHAVVEYAKNGDPGALRYMRQRFPESGPFGAWARRTEANRSVADDTAAEPAPPELVAEVREALDRLKPLERQALREALRELS
jgi:hypothetical protein